MMISASNYNVKEIFQIDEPGFFDEMGYKDESRVAIL